MFTHLHLHDCYSILDGVSLPSEYVSKAKELGMKSIGITNHGNVDSVIKFQNECNKEGLNLIIGCELYLVQNLYKKEKGEKRSHVCVWVKNEIGWKNLLQMLTIANLEGFYYRPRVDVETLLKHCEGLVIGTACVSTFLNQDWGLELLKNLKEKTEVFIEMMPSNFELQNETNKKLLQIAQDEKIDIIATNDCHYVNKEDYEAQETLLCINSRDKWSNPNRWKFQSNDFYFKDELEMTESFKKQDVLTRREIRTSINNTEKIVDLCKDFQLKQVEIALPRVKRVIESKLSDLDYLTKLIEEGYIEKDIQSKHNREEYDNRIKEEVELIKMKGFERYFLIVWDLIQWSESNDIMTGPGRGSAAGSLVCYLLGITKVDPIEFKLMFFRFINPARADLPDIDSDFPDNRREEVVNHLKEIYGENHVSGISTFGFLKTRSIIRDLGRVFEMDKDEINMIAKSCEEKGTFEDLLATTDGQTFAKKYPKQIRIGKILEGNVRSRGRHACGTIISEEDLTLGNKASLNIDKKSQSLMCNWDKQDIEFQGLMKLDVLGLNALSVINECKNLIKERHHITIDFNKLPLEDRKILRRFTKGDNTGCFQLNTYGLKKFCKKLKIDSFMDIVHATSLFRPGTLGNGTAEDFIKRKNKEQDWTFIHPLLEPITGYTYGIIVYQEQAMQMVHELAGLDWATTNKIRKVIAKTQGIEALMEYKDMFVQGCLDMKTLDEDTAVKVFKDLASFGSYGFNKCFSGKMKIDRDNSIKGGLTIEEMYKTKNDKEWAKKNNHSSLSDKYKREGYGKAYSLKDNKLYLNNIIDIYYQGVKKTYTITLENNKKIRVTDNHKFPVIEKEKIEYTTIKNGLKVGDYLISNEGYDKTKTKNYNFTNITQNEKTFKKYSGCGFKKGEQNSSYINGESIKFEKYKKEIRIEANFVCQKCKKISKSIEIHHIDGNRKNNERCNLIGLCPSCHKKEHYNKLNRKRKNEKGAITEKIKIVSIELFGEEEVYDVEMEHPYHTLSINGIVASNCHAVSYSHITYWDMYLKQYYPIEFYCANLNCGSKVEANKEEMILDAVEKGFDIRPPKTDISSPTEWIIKKDILYAPFSEIKGYGDTGAKKIANINSNKLQNKKMGFFEMQSTKPLTKSEQESIELLKEIEAEKDIEVSKDKSYKIKKYFGYRFK